MLAVRGPTAGGAVSKIICITSNNHRAEFFPIGDVVKSTFQMLDVFLEPFKTGE